VGEVSIAGSEDLRLEELEELRAFLNNAFAESFDDHDWKHTVGGLHVLAREGEIVAHAAVVERTLIAGDRLLATGYVEGVATAPGSRRRGLGTLVMQKANEIIKEGFELGALSTGVPGFFSRLGWEQWRGPTFVDAPGARMRTAEDDDGIFILRTPATEDLDATAPLVCDWRQGDVW
jgi:aminoglycoside 2'-N-acetyltransferase I